jgi:hypothetical protein
MAHKIFGRNRLFHTGQIEILQSTDALDRAGTALRLIEVEHQPHAVADRPPHIGDDGQIALDVSRAKLDLDRLDARDGRLQPGQVGSRIERADHHAGKSLPTGDRSCSADRVRDSRSPRHRS